MPDKHIGVQIKNLRVSKGFTQDVFAEKLQLTPNYISAVERGVKSPSLDALIAMINILGVSADEVFADVIDNVYSIQTTILSADIRTIPLEEQKRIFAVVKTMISEVKNVSNL
jgi:transcriptional regulator with XRE-family HTH domain